MNDENLQILLKLRADRIKELEEMLAQAKENLAKLQKCEVCEAAAEKEPPKCAHCEGDLGSAHFSNVPGQGDLCSECHRVWLENKST